MTFAQIIEYAKRGIFTLLGLFLALYLFVILMTYTANDPSWSHISSDMTHINNMGGAMGAWLSDLLYVFFGWGAWWLFAFLVYESVLIWWDNKPTFGPLRVIAYVFLLLAGSALVTQLFALFQGAAVGEVIEGMAGGVVGQELSTRLSMLMTSIGSLLFLLIFVLITATFAFNIHWKVLAGKIASRAWLGSGVKRSDDSADDQQDHYYDEAEHEGAEYDELSEEDYLTEKANKYGQLPLPLRPASATAEQPQMSDADSAEDATAYHSRDTRAGLSNVLNEFLVKSGLGASLQQQLAAEKQAQAEYERQINQESEPQRQADSITQPRSQTGLAASQQKQKIEPSFEWNDQQLVSSLLAAEAATATNPMQSEAPQQTLQTATNTQLESVSKPHDTIADTTVTTSEVPVKDAALQPAKTQWEDGSGDDDKIVEASLRPLRSGSVAEVDPLDDSASSIDELADAWLANSEHEALPVDWEADKPKLNIIEPPAPQPQDNSYTDSSSAQQQQDLSDDRSYTTEQLEPVTAAPVTAIDMTPTNTPPANPTQPPREVDQEQTTAKQSMATPDIRFAVPEGNASNHIEDMVPDSDEVYLPPIEDDEAYASRSRAMQTAKYRESLTPIPEISILDKPDPDRKPSYTVAELEQLSELLEIKLQEFNVKAEVKNAIPGPVVTRFEVELAAGVKASKVTGISRDLARSLSMASLRVVEVIPGKPYIGIEVPNKKREMVRLIELLSTEQYQDPKAQISMAMGKDIGGNPIITDLARAPHMLVAGTTGSGKSVLVNSMLLSMLLKYKPDELRLILIDPKQLELANYNDIPHLLTPVVTDMTEAASSLSWCVAEMERRYQLMSLLKVRKLGEFNKKVIAAEKAGRPIIDPLWRPNDSVSMDRAPKLKTLPMIVIVADEFADMIMQVGKQAEELITRLAQKSRAAGIHLMLATQRPSVDVITGLIKANIPVRAALRVNSKVDSRTILDAGGAEDMLGNGDMLFLGPGQIEPERVHGAYVSDEEVNRVCDAWRERGAPDYIDNMASNFELTSPGDSGGNTSGEDDALYDEAVAFVMETRKVSASSIQRKFSIGYNRAARIVDSMEEAGLVSSMGKSGKRELLM